MPQATDEHRRQTAVILQQKNLEALPEPSDCEKYLESIGVDVDTHGLLRTGMADVTDDAWVVANYLVDEWDYEVDTLR